MLIESHEPDWLSKVNNQVSESLADHPDSSAYALLDLAFAPQCFEQLVTQRSALRYQGLYDRSPRPDPLLSSVSPTLIELTPETDTEWKRVLEHSNGWPMLSIFVTPESLDELAERLSAWCIVDADGTEFVLRFADTRRLPDIVSSLTPQQHGQLFGPAYAVMCRSRAAQWTSLPLPQVPQAAATHVKFAKAQVIALISASEPDEMLDVLRRDEPSLLAEHSPAAAYEVVCNALDGAGRYGIDGYDRIRWCGVMLTNPDIEREPAAAGLLETLSKGAAVYADIHGRLNGLAAR